MPLLFQPEEPQHAMRAAAVARGEFTWTKRENVVYDNFFFVRRTNTVVEIPEGYATLEDIPVCGAIVTDRDASCARAISTSETIVEGRPYTGTYPPLTAIIQSPGGHFAAPVGLVVMRLCTVLVASALLASSFVTVRRLGGGFVAVGFGLALSPVVLSLTSAINPSAIEISAAIGVWLTLIDVLRPGPVQRRAVWRAVILACIFVLSRPLSPGLLVIIAASLMIAMPWRAQLRTIWQERWSWVWLTVLATAIAIAIAWFVYARPDHGVVGYDDNLPFAEEVRESVRRTGWRARELVGYLSWLTIPLPDVVVWGWLAVTTALAGIATALSSWRRRLAFAVLVMGTVFGPSLAELPTSSTYGLIWQGRYTLPVAVGIPILAGWTLHERGLDRARAGRVVGLALVVAAMAAHLVAFAVTLTRWASGRLSPLDVVWGPQPWSADVRGWVVLTVAGAGLAGLGVLLGWLIVRPQLSGTASPAPTDEIARQSAPKAAVC